MLPIYLLHDIVILFIVCGDWRGILFVFFLQNILAQTPNDLLKEYNKHAYFSVPILNKEQLKSLLEGKVVKVIDHNPNESGPSRAVGYFISNFEKEDLWIATQDPHFTVQSSTTEFLLERDKTVPDKTMWYGYLDAPWPINDRYWVVSSWNNHSLSEKTNNLYWEHPWELLKEGPSISRKYMDQNVIKKGTKAQLDSAIYTPYNQGAWGMMSIVDTSISGNTLIVYHAKTVVGGSIPESLILQITYNGLDDLLRDLDERTRKKVPVHYVKGHDVIYGGHGKIIPPKYPN